MAEKKENVQINHFNWMRTPIPFCKEKTKKIFYGQRKEKGWNQARLDMGVTYLEFKQNCFI